MSKPTKSKSQSVGSRSAKLLGLSGRLALKSFSGLLSSRSKSDTRIAQAQMLMESLSELKGAAMKAGQLLSLDSSDLLPPQAIEILSKLQNQAEPHDFSEIEVTLKRELADKLSQLKDISQKPIAAASIGQVHTAFLNCEKLAIKVQYDGIAKSIDSDLKILRRLAESFLSITGKSIPLEETFKELKNVLEEEVDYENEMTNLIKYNEFMKATPGYVVPKAYPDFTTKQVLTMSFVEGIGFQEWLDGKPSLQERELMAHSILKLFCLEFIDWGFVQTDPNFANYLIQNDPLKLVCLDFGATLAYPMEFRAGYARLLERLKSSSTHEIFAAAMDFDLLSEKEDRETQIAFKEMIQIALEPFRSDKQPFNFQDQDFAKRTAAANIRFSQRLKHSAPPHKILFLHRKLGGVFNMVKRLEVRIDLLPYWHEMTKFADQ